MSQRALLTGANGFIAQHILSQFLEAGHSVRAVVRTQRSADQLRATFPSSRYPSSQLDFALVPDITVSGAFDPVLVSDPPFDLVLHTASPFHFSKGISNADFLDAAVNGTTEILEGDARVAPRVRRVVVTSSMAAVIDYRAVPVSDPLRIYTEKDWNSTSREEVEAEGAGEDPVLAYVTSKTLVERAAWEFVDDEDKKKKPAFDAVTINPPMVYGPVFDASVVGNPRDLGQSNSTLYDGFLDPKLTSESPVPPAGLRLYVDVRDVARAHLLAATKPEAGGKRFVVSPGGISNQRIANVLREKLPELQGRIPRGEPEKTALPDGLFGVDSSLAKSVLGLKFTKEEDTFGDAAAQFIEIEKRAASAAQSLL